MKNADLLQQIEELRYEIEELRVELDHALESSGDSDEYYEKSLQMDKLIEEHIRLTEQLNSDV